LVDFSSGFYFFVPLAPPAGKGTKGARDEEQRARGRPWLWLLASWHWSVFSSSGCYFSLSTSGKGGDEGKEAMKRGRPCFWPLDRVGRFLAFYFPLARPQGETKETRALLFGRPIFCFSFFFFFCFCYCPFFAGEDPLAASALPQQVTAHGHTRLLPLCLLAFAGRVGIVTIGAVVALALLLWWDLWPTSKIPRRDGWLLLVESLCPLSVTK
jgi:hypothetical protein